MTIEECVQVLTPLALALRAEMDVPTFRAYHRVLKDVPPGLLEAAVDGLLKSGARFMPSAPELLTAAEKSRRQWLALNPYDGCAECEAQRGWRTVLGASGQPVVERCPCVERYRARLETIGLSEALTALPGEAGVGENEQVFPTVEQLPADIQRRLKTVAGQKVLR